MTEQLGPDLSGIPERGFDQAAVLNAISGLFGADRSGAAKINKALKALTARTDNWSEQARRLDKAGLGAHHIDSTLREALELPGDLALLYLQGGGFLLLHRQRQRWQTLDAHGQPLADVPDSAGDALTEAVVLRMPRKEVDKPNGFSSMAALWPALRAAWAEVGLASVFINIGLLLVPLFSMLVYDKVVNNGVFETL